MFKIDDVITYRGTLGKIVDKKIVQTPSFLNDFTLFKVEFENSRREWINVIYLTKVM